MAYTHVRVHVYLYIYIQVIDAHRPLPSILVEEALLNGAPFELDLAVFDVAQVPSCLSKFVPLQEVFKAVHSARAEYTVKVCKEPRSPKVSGHDDEVASMERLPIRRSELVKALACRWDREPRILGFFSHNLDRSLSCRWLFVKRTHRQRSQRR